MRLDCRSDDRRRQQTVTTNTIGRVSMTSITCTTVRSQIKLVIVISVWDATVVTIARRRARVGGAVGGGFIGIFCTVGGVGSGIGR